MGVMILRPGQRLIAPHVCIVQPSMAAAAASGWWLSGGISAANCVAAYAPKGAASLAASYINLNNPGTNNAAPGVAPTFATGTGWTFNGTTQYLTTGISPSSGWSLVVCFNGVSNTGHIVSIFKSASAQLYIRPNDGTGVTYGNGGAVSKTPTAASGVFAVAGNAMYRNGSAETGSISAWSGSIADSQGICIGCRRRVDNLTQDQFCAATVVAVAIYNTVLPVSQIASLTTAMNAL